MHLEASKCFRFHAKTHYCGRYRAFTRSVLVLECIGKLWKFIIPFSRTWKVLEKGGNSKWLWKGSRFLLGKILQCPEIDII